MTKKVLITGITGFVGSLAIKKGEIGEIAASSEKVRRGSLRYLLRRP